jgi:two-component system, NtrC family, nitrogen regulation response regulator NtrX
MMPREAALAQGAEETIGAAMPLVLTGTSPAVSRLRADIDAARGSACVLIETESGLDVADIARQICRGGSGPLVTVACGAAEPAAIERELFGSRRHGTGDADLESIAASSAIAQARDGALYLDDVCDLSAMAQSRLARIVRDGEAVISGAGGSAAGGTTVPLHLTLVASMLPEQAGAGGLRRDLQKHLERCRVVVPPLRRRAEDIPLLVEQMIAAAAARSGLPALAVTHPAMTLLGAMPWRGNLIELRQALARLTAAAAGGVIQLEDVLTHVRFDGSLAPKTPAGTLRDARQQFERDYIALVIAHHRGHIGAAAQALGMQRTNLYRKARQLGLAVRGHK